MNTAVEQLKFEDDKRCLYSLSKSKTASVKLPIFNGDGHEDFSKFRKEMEKGMKINRIRRYDQVTKLRECLRQHPKKLIPQTMEDIDEAWKILSNVYGDPTRVMAARKQKLSDLGQLPANGKDADVLRKQVEWLITLETTLGDIVELAESNSDMEYEAYNGAMVRTIRQLFHIDMLDELTFRGTAQYKVTKMKEFAVHLREIKQELLKDHEGTDGSHGHGIGDSNGGCADIVGSNSDGEAADMDCHSDDCDEEHRLEPGDDAQDA